MVEQYASLDEQEKKRKKKIEKINKELQKSKEIQAHLSKNKINLKELQSLVKEGMITIDDKQLFAKISKDEILEDQELDELLQSIQLKDILDKIQDIENIMDIDKILPKDLRISKNDFMLACKDPHKKQEVLQKLDQGLDYIVPQVSPGFKSGGNPFARNASNLANLVFLANKKVISVQESMIDLKNYLHSK